MQRISHEVELSEHTEGDSTYKELLTFLADGKKSIYAPHEEQPKPQAAQKGETCWYYALNRIRTRYGKESRPHANRYVEKVVSEYRKGLSSLEMTFSFVSQIVENTFQGIDSKKNISGKFRNFINTKFETEKQYDDLSLLYSLRENLIEQLSYTLSHDQEKVTQKLEELMKLIFDGFCDAESIKKIMSKKLSFHECMTGIMLLASDQLQKVPNGDKLKKRLGLFAIASLEMFLDDIEEIDNLNLLELCKYLRESYKVVILHTLVEKLDIKAPANFFEKLLTTGVYNSVMLNIGKEIAKEMTRSINSRRIPNFGKKLTADSVLKFKEFYSFGQLLAYQRIVELYDLQILNWTPKNGFEGLTLAIKDHGPLVMTGKNIGLPAYKTSATTLMNGDKPVKIGSRAIKFWSEADLRPTTDLESSGHAVIVIGTQSIKKSDTTEEYVFFLDPNDASVPGEERIMYRLSYKDFSAKLMMQNGITISDHNNRPEGEFYAVARMG